MSELVTYQCDPCVVCGIASELRLLKEDLETWRSGMLVHRAFPYLSADNREVLISGTHPECWEKLYGPENPELDQ